MLPRLVLHCASHEGVEQVWLVDHVNGQRGEDLVLTRSGAHVVTLCPDDYALSLVVEPFIAVPEPPSDAMH